MSTPMPNLPALSMLVAAFKLVHGADAAAQRAADKTAGLLPALQVQAFDAVELRTLSSSRRSDGVEHVTDYLGCTCEGQRHPWCRHRVEYRLLLAELALRDPAELIRLVLEQAAPASVEAADVAAVGQAQQAIAAIVASPLDLDDAAYADLVAGIPLTITRPTVSYTAADAAIDELYPA